MTRQKPVPIERRLKARNTENNFSSLNSLDVIYQLLFSLNHHTRKVV